MRDEIISPTNGFTGEAQREEPLGAELWRMWNTEIKPHFQAEREFLEKYGEEAGYDRTYIARVLDDHRLMEQLVWKNGDEGVAPFAKMLAAHIRYKQEFFTGRVRKIVESQEIYFERPIGPQPS